MLIDRVSDKVWQDIYYGIRDKTRVIADQHANLGRTIDSSIVQHLQKLRSEIKAHIKVRLFFSDYASRANLTSV